MKKKRFSALYLTRASIISALYVVLTYLSAVLGLSGSAVQFRLSEALCVLPIFFPEAVPGLTVGCIISNLITSANPLDIIFGSIATLIGALGARLLQRLPKRLMWLATLPTVIINSLIVPPVIIFAYGSGYSYPFILLSVFVGEAVCAGVLGFILYLALRKVRLK